MPTFLNIFLLSTLFKKGFVLKIMLNELSAKQQIKKNFLQKVPVNKTIILKKVAIQYTDVT